MPLQPFIQRLTSNEHLSADEAYRAMDALLEGNASPTQISAFLIALKMKVETAEELAGFARAMREHAAFVDAGDDLIDTCGTGGTGDGTFNISTVASIVMAGAGARVAKHGNRSISNSTGGSADMVEALGVRFAMSPEDAVRAIREIGIGFLFAPHLHPAMKHAQPIRRELKVRTVFNLLGPLANPARAKSQLIGAPSRYAAKLLADALAILGGSHAFVVHGILPSRDGLDEISIFGPTIVYEVTDKSVKELTWTPADFGLEAAPVGSLAGGDGARNAEIALEILSGAKGPRRDVVLMNAAAGLVAGGRTHSLRSAVLMAAIAIDSGTAQHKLTQLQEAFPYP